jgi:hypothetical protein
MEAIRTSVTSVNFSRLHDASSQNTSSYSPLWKPEISQRSSSGNFLRSLPLHQHTKCERRGSNPARATVGGRRRRAVSVVRASKGPHPYQPVPVAAHIPLAAGRTNELSAATDTNRLKNCHFLWSIRGLPVPVQMTTREKIQRVLMTTREKMQRVLMTTREKIQRVLPFTCWWWSGWQRRVDL